ncbi:PQQ-binding-like beta-propeller repeat protein [Haloferula sp.]|uniref:PQQ-binding-like beta-propeller repeat protein n=1 Tax=Haloferula sp. TaxID=2497595 RepID=UPI0032A002B7
MILLRPLLFSILGVLPGLSEIPDWGEWRGPTRDGQIHKGAKAWPETLGDENFKKQWSVDLAEGYSSPIAVENRVFTVETSDKKNEVVRAFDRGTGEQLWESSWKGSMMVPFYAAKNGSWVRSTPACDGKLLYVGGMRDVLVALDVQSGDVKWRVDFPEEAGTQRPQFGFVCSPLLGEDYLYVQAGSALRKIRKSDGKTMWKTLEDDRAMFGEAFSSPIWATIGGRKQIVVQTRMLLAGVSPENGEVLWSTPVKAFRGMNILTPTPVGDHVFTASYGGGTFWYEIDSDDESQSVTELWNDKLEGNMSSPLVIDGKVYLHGRDKRFHCIDPGEKKVLWSTKNIYGDYWSMVANGNRILALDDRGTLMLIEADAGEFKLVNELEVSARPTWAHASVCGNEVLVRDLKGLTSYRWE